jgi:hypothetical protein
MANKSDNSASTTWALGYIHPITNDGVMVMTPDLDQLWAVTMPTRTHSWYSGNYRFLWGSHPELTVNSHPLHFYLDAVNFKKKESKKVWSKLLAKLAARPYHCWTKVAVAGTSSHCISSFPPDDASLLAASVSHGKARAKARRSDLYFSRERKMRKCHWQTEQNSSSLHGAGGCAMCEPRTVLGRWCVSQSVWKLMNDACSAAVEEQRLTWTDDLSSLRQSRTQLQVGFNHRFRLVVLLRCGRRASGNASANRILRCLCSSPYPNVVVLLNIWRWRCHHWKVTQCNPVTCWPVTAASRQVCVNPPVVVSLSVSIAEQETANELRSTVYYASTEVRHSLVKIQSAIVPLRLRTKGQRASCSFIQANELKLTSTFQLQTLPARTDSSIYLHISSTDEAW